MIIIGTIHSALAGSIGQNIFINILSQRVTENLPAIDPADVISAGAANLQKVASTSEILQVLREAYAAAVHDVFVYALVAACMALIFTGGMEWLNLKVVAEQRGLTNRSSGDNSIEK